jgi:D-3-phosphoglycerate dehydrogenase
MRGALGLLALRRIGLGKVLVSDSLASQGLDVLRHADGLEVIDQPGITPGDLLACIADFEGLVIRSGTKVTAEVIERADKLRVIGRAGIGVDNVDVAAATERGIAVLNTPEGNNITTAEHAISLLLSLARHIPSATASVKAGHWEKKKFTGIELFNRTLGGSG